ncbi:UNVERIFIED_CONTAM: hypothetical protein NCL1_33842 [Trichonephila clavipes]
MRILKSRFNPNADEFETMSSRLSLCYATPGATLRSVTWMKNVYMYWSRFPLNLSGLKVPMFENSTPVLVSTMSSATIGKNGYLVVYKRNKL